jgi:hypothetical protein
MFEIRDLTGQVFGRLVVLEFDHLDGHHHAMWKCECACGTICVKRSNNLLNGTFSCGCLRRELGLPAIRKNADQRGRTGADHPMHGVRFKKKYSTAGRLNPNYKHGHKIGGERSPTYLQWYYIVLSHADRCARWRGRGAFARFLADVGVRPAGSRLVRINSHHPWARKNCEWQKQQAA